MLIPLGTNRPLRRTPYVTQALILLNLAAFIGLLAWLGPDYGEMARRVGLVWRPSEPWRLVSYAFAHGGWWHIAGNLLILWVFGPSVEDRLGHAGFTVFYLAGAAVAGGVHVALETSPVIGASGAIAAVTGAYMVLFPRTLVRTLVLFIIIGVINIPALWYIVFAIAKDLLLVGAGDGVARGAHIGGYGLGIVVGFTLLATGLLPREDFDLFYLIKHGRRRRKLREAVETAQRTRPGPKAATPAEPTLPAEALRLRAQIAGRLNEQDFPGAAHLYSQLAEAFAETPGAASLTKRHQLLIANHLFSTGDYARAAAAYERFLETHAHDSESPNVRLLLGLLRGRYLGDHETGRKIIAEAAPRLGQPEDQALARELLAEFGGVPATGA